MILFLLLPMREDFYNIKGVLVLSNLFRMARSRDLNIREVCFLMSCSVRTNIFIALHKLLFHMIGLFVFFFWWGDYTEVSDCVFCFVFIRKVPHINRSDSLSGLFERTFSCIYFCIKK